MVCFVNAQTTDQEYQYITEGYKKDKNDGRDIKSGYRLEPIGTLNNITQGDHIRYSQLYAFKKGTETTAFVIECSETKNNFSFYLCIPTSNSTAAIWKKYWETLRSIDKEWHLLLAWSLSSTISQKLQ